MGMAGMADKIHEPDAWFTVREIMEQWAINYDIEVEAPAMTMLVGLVEMLMSAEREACARKASQPKPTKE